MHGFSLSTRTISQCSWQHLSALTAAPKLKYESLLGGLQHMVYFYAHIPAVKNMCG